MLPILIVWAAYFYGLFRAVFHGFRINNFLTTVIVFGVGFFAISIWSGIHLAKPRRRRAQTRTGTAQPRQQAPRPSSSSSGSSGSSGGSHEITFRVAGTSFSNDDGTGRQEILRGLKFGDAPYSSGADPDVDIEETSYNGELALAVTVNGFQVGFVPKQNISQVKKALDSFAWTADTCRIIGGGTSSSGERMSYGCEITISWAD